MTKSKIEKTTRPKLAKLKFNKTEASILKSLHEAVQWAKGEEVAGMRLRQVNVPATLDVKAIRQQLSMSQTEFAECFGFSPSTLRNWEQGTRQPETTARVLLTIIARAPKVVQQVLRS
jgi:putative transcriptional regulator